MTNNQPKPVDPRVLKLREICYFLHKRLPSGCTITAKDIFNELKKGFHGVHHLDPNWSLPINTPSNHNLIVLYHYDTRGKLVIRPLLKALWALYYPELVPKIRHKFEYAQFMSCNPLMARPPAYMNIGFESRVMCDQIFMNHTHKNTIEPVQDQQIFEIMEDDDFDFIEEY